MVSAGSVADDGLWKALRGRVPELHAAGDCLAPRKLMNAALDGLRAGLAV